jgi:hypothetical protein
MTYPACRYSLRQAKIGFQMRRTQVESARLPRQESVSIYIEDPGLLFASRFTEGIVGRAYLNFGKATLFQHRAPAFARKAAGDSSSPEIDAAHRALRHGLAIGDIGKL